MQNVEKSNDEWKKELTPKQYRILREQGTETPFTGAYVKTRDKGIYRCAGCGSDLFDSVTKFDSGTGWPSFDRAIPGAVELNEDSSHRMRRTEVVCARCGGHLGHVFKDGPTETCDRFCINSGALNLKKNE